ncbi:MAG: DNA-binding MarR family transcriptional regulator [Bacteriovoracaceae bacterium]|jgi:DNA-binding MarR family transcriptional regulator
MTIEVKIEDALCFNLYSASRAMTQVYRPYLTKLGLTYPQFLVMLLLWEKSNEKLTVKDLGKRLHLDSGTLTPLLKRLEGNELLERARSLEDEREVNVKLTRKGKNLEKKCSDLPMEMFCNLKVSMDEFVQVRDGVSKILENLNEKINEFKTLN